MYFKLFYISKPCSHTRQYDVEIDFVLIPYCYCKDLAGFHGKATVKIRKQENVNFLFKALSLYQTQYEQDD